MWIIEKLGSLVFTGITCVGLIIVLIVSTSLESIHGTPFAQKVFYQNQWFNVLLALLWINIFCATLRRLPFKKHHLGFVATHIGILGLLLGALVTRLFAIDGQMSLFEGEISRQIQLGGHQLNVSLPGKGGTVLELKEGNHFLLGKESNEKISIQKILEHASKQQTVREGTSADPSRYALKVTLTSATMGFNQSLWLVENNGDIQPDSSTALVGPVNISLKQGKKSETTSIPTLLIFDKNGQELAVVDLTKIPSEEIILKDSRLKISQLRYYPHAKVAGKTLTDVPGTGFNPAVEFDVVGPDQQSQHYVKFAFFPDFESLHHKTGSQIMDITTRLDVPYEKEEGVGGKTSLAFIASSDEGLGYQVSSEGKVVAEGKVAVGDEIKLGRMNMSARVEEILTHAQASYEITSSSDDKQGVLAVEVNIQNKQASRAAWVLEGQEEVLPTSIGDMSLALVPTKKDLPFFLTLKDFRKKDYPGTSNPSSFESDVILYDPIKDTQFEKTISMNQPLDYKGFRMFQSSYVQNSDGQEASIFTVAKNPGITLIYISSIILFVGAMLQFYVKPFAHELSVNPEKAQA